MTPYRFLYRFGITPWERDETPAPIEKLAEQLQPGRALDIGCGTGRHAVLLAQRGWSVTGVDYVEQALAEARRRASGAGVEVTWVQGDVAQLDRLGLGEGYDLLLDRGCFHGLSDGKREACARGMTALATPGARLLLFAFQPRRGLGPRGVTPDQLRNLLTDAWQLRTSEQEPNVRLPWWLGDARPGWYEFERRA